MCNKKGVFRSGIHLFYYMHFGDYLKSEMV